MAENLEQIMNGQGESSDEPKKKESMFNIDKESFKEGGKNHWLLMLFMVSLAFYAGYKIKK